MPNYIGIVYHYKVTFVIYFMKWAVTFVTLFVRLEGNSCQAGAMQSVLKNGNIF